MKKKLIIYLIFISTIVGLVNGGVTYEVFAQTQSISTYNNSTNPSPPPSTTSDQTNVSFPISIYDGGTNVTFHNGAWGNITASISPNGVGGSNCITYSNLQNNSYSPGPEIVFSSPIDISNMVDTDRLHLIMDIGIVQTSQPVRIIFNGDPSLNVVTPNLNKTSVFEEVNLDISNIRAKLGGQITKISFEGAGPNGWQGVSNLYVNEISIIRPADSTTLPIIAPVAPPQLATDALPISIFHDESNIYFNPPAWGGITGEVASEGIGGSNCIKYSNLMNNVYAPSPEAVFPSPINISSMADTDRFQISVSLGNASPPQAVKIIFNGDPSLNIVTPILDTSTGFQTLNLDISSIRQYLGGQITQVSFESAGPNGWDNVSNLYIDEISIVDGNLNSQTNGQSTANVTDPMSIKASIKGIVPEYSKKVNFLRAVQNNPIVTFKSKGLESAIRTALRKPSGNLYKSDVEKITALNAQHKGIGDLNGIENLTNLQTLDLDHNLISDINALTKLTNLKNLDLNNNKISDMSALKGLTNLQTLSLGYNNISNISPLKGLAKLHSLDLSNYYHASNYISDISALKGLTNLQYLYLSNTKTSDISALKGLTKLNSLYLDNYKFCDINILKGLTNLQTLYLDDNQIKDITALKGLSKLQYLYLSNDRITDITALNGLTNLKYLYLSNAQISNISALKGLIKLQILYLDNNQIKDISALKGLTNLQTLYLDDNQIKDITALKGLTNLQHLYLSNNQISDISSIKGLTKLQMLYLNNSQIKDITALKGLVNLQTLYLNQSKIRDINTLKGLTRLQYLYLSNAQISDISALKGLTGLHTIDLRNNQIINSNKVLLEKSLNRCKIYF